jgi:predicted nucleic acid-binding protein
MSEETKLKVYLETSFVSYLTGRPTTQEPIATWQAVSRQWWEAVAPDCDLFVSRYVLIEAEQGNADQAALRLEALRNIPLLDIEPVKIKEVATALIREHALPGNETTDAYHIATAAYYGMDVLLTWNCKHIANEFTLPKTYNLLNSMGLKCPVILTPKRYMEDCNHD